jgi:hypothetical protein
MAKNQQKSTKKAHFAFKMSKKRHKLAQALVVEAVNLQKIAQNSQFFI